MANSPVRVAQAQVRADVERAIAMSQAAHAKLPAAAARNSIAHPTAAVVKEPPTSVTAPRPSKTIPAPMRTPAKKRRWRHSHGAIMRCMPDRGGRCPPTAQAFGSSAVIGCVHRVTPVGCGVRPLRNRSRRESAPERWPAGLRTYLAQLSAAWPAGSKLRQRIVDQYCGRYLGWPEQMRASTSTEVG